MDKRLLLPIVALWVILWLEPVTTSSEISNRKKEDLYDLSKINRQDDVLRRIIEKRRSYPQNVYFIPARRNRRPGPVEKGRHLPSVIDKTSRYSNKFVRGESPVKFGTFFGSLFGGLMSKKTTRAPVLMRNKGEGVELLRSGVVRPYNQDVLLNLKTASNPLMIMPGSAETSLKSILKKDEPIIAQSEMLTTEPTLGGGEVDVIIEDSKAARRRVPTHGNHGGPSFEKTHGALDDAAEQQQDTSTLSTTSSAIMLSTPPYNDETVVKGKVRKGKGYYFAHEVLDEPTRNYQAREEENKDGKTRGFYSWLRPDGRLQLVQYYAGDDTGFVADVASESHEIFPDPAVTADYADSRFHEPKYDIAIIEREPDPADADANEDDTQQLQMDVKGDEGLNGGRHHQLELVEGNSHPDPNAEEDYTFLGPYAALHDEAVRNSWKKSYEDRMKGLMSEGRSSTGDEVRPGESAPASEAGQASPDMMNNPGHMLTQQKNSMKDDGIQNKEPASDKLNFHLAHSIWAHTDAKDDTSLGAIGLPPAPLQRKIKIKGASMLSIGGQTTTNDNTSTSISNTTSSTQQDDDDMKFIDLPPKNIPRYVIPSSKVKVFEVPSMPAADGTIIRRSNKTENGTDAEYLVERPSGKVKASKSIVHSKNKIQLIEQAVDMVGDILNRWQGPPDFAVYQDEEQPSVDMGLEDVPDAEATVELSLEETKHLKDLLNKITELQPRLKLMAEGSPPAQIPKYSNTRPSSTAVNTATGNESRFFVGMSHPVADYDDASPAAAIGDFNTSSHDNKYLKSHLFGRDLSQLREWQPRHHLVREQQAIKQQDSDDLDYDDITLRVQLQKWDPQKEDSPAVNMNDKSSFKLPLVEPA